MTITANNAKELFMNTGSPFGEGRGQMSRYKANLKTQQVSLFLQIRNEII